MVSMVSRLDTVIKIPMGNKPVITNLTVSQLIVNHHLSNNKHFSNFLRVGDVLVDMK